MVSYLYNKQSEKQTQREISFSHEFTLGTTVCHGYQLHNFTEFKMTVKIIDPMKVEINK